MDRDLFEAELLRSFVARVADDDDALLIDNKRLSEPESLDGGGDGVDGGIVVPGVVGIGLHVGQFPERDFHGSSLSGTGSRGPGGTERRPSQPRKKPLHGAPAMLSSARARHDSREPLP